MLTESTKFYCFNKYSVTKKRHACQIDPMWIPTMHCHETVGQWRTLAHFGMSNCKVESYISERWKFSTSPPNRDCNHSWTLLPFTMEAWGTEPRLVRMGSKCLYLLSQLIGPEMPRTSKPSCMINLCVSKPISKASSVQPSLAVINIS